MPRAITNKQLAVLAVLREFPAGITAQKMADLIRERTPCGTCDGTGEGPHEHWGCHACYGHGVVRFHYSDAYNALQRLVKSDLAERRQKLDEWGDPTQGVVYLPAAVVAEPDDDPLEKLFALPSAEPDSGGAPNQEHPS
jgi:hypothetical protein